MSSYPIDILVDAEWLTQHLADPRLKILDVRAGDPQLPVGYSIAHVPGAIALNPGREFFVFANGRIQLAPPERIATALAQHGITNASTIILYDEYTDQAVAVTFWALRYLGHTNTHILNGGWAGWVNHGNPVTAEMSQIHATEYHAQLCTELQTDAEWIQANATRADVCLLDVRSHNEYSMGHIPSAVNLPYERNIDARTLAFKDEATLRAQLEAVGATLDKEIIVYCHSGMRSSHMFLALNVLGYPRVRNYFGSMADWFERRRLPIE